MRTRDASFAARARPGWPRGTPSVTDARCFSTALVRSQCALTSSGVVAVASPKTWGWRWIELGDDAAGHVVDGEGGLLGVLLGDAGVEDDLEQDVAQFLAQFVAVALLDGLDEFVRLLDAVLRQALVGLLGRPGALGADAVHDLDEVEEAGAGQVVGGGEQFQVRHLHAAGAGQAGQAVGEARARPRRWRPRPTVRPPAQASTSSSAVGDASSTAMPASRRYGSCGCAPSAHSTRSAACSACQAGQDSRPGATRWLVVSRTIRPGPGDCVVRRRAVEAAGCVHPSNVTHATDSPRSCPQGRGHR